GERGPAFFYADHRATCAVCRRDAVFSQEGARETLEAAREALASVLASDRGKIETAVTLLPRPELHAKAGPLANRWLKGLTEVEEEGAQDGKRGARRYRIFVLYGLPRAGLLGVLCHELFHVFQSEKNPKTLEADAAFREGAANYVQVCVLNARGESLRARLLERQGDSVYGEGLRRFEKLAADRGLRRAIELGAREQRFPDGY
ncbi:hypothetical protein HY251_11625, partial [bacterium]|nr:hypothetical protein [bacterium]